MSNEQFFLQLVEKGYFRFCSPQPSKVENGVKTYYFNFYGLDPLGGEDIVTANKIRFNVVGGFIDMQEI